MVLYRKSKPHNAADQLKKGSSLSEGHFPHGFLAEAFFNFGEIYFEDEIYRLINCVLEKEIEQCLSRLAKDDFGEVSADEKDENIENKYLGNGKNILGRYLTSIGIVEIKVLEECTIVSAGKSGEKN